MSMPPFSHHEILALSAPFLRAGYRPELAASRRPARVLCFVARLDPAAAAAGRSVLELANPEPGRYRLTRVLTAAQGLDAAVHCEGGDVAALLAEVLSLAPERVLRATPVGLVALSFGLALRSPGRGAAPPRAPRLIAAEALCRGLRLRLRPGGPGGALAELALECDEAARPRLPEDLFAVLGWRWSRLREVPQGWRATLQLPRREPQRSRQAEADFERLYRHLATTLAASPAAFHARHQAARWAVYARRSLPLACCVALLAATAVVPRLDLAENSVVRMLIFNSPPLLLIAFFCLREVPRIEIPPRPRRGPDAGWDAGAGEVR